MTKFLTGFLIMALPGWGQVPSCSARAIFFGPGGAIPPQACASTPEPEKESTVREQPKGKGTTKEQTANAATKQQAVKGPTQISPPQDTVVRVSNSAPLSALRYWIELLAPNGEKQRVDTNRVFHSGEQILIHFESNVTGRLTIALLQPDGSSKVLFPSATVNAGDNLMQARTDTAIPPSGQFRFDNETGIERLLVFLNPGTAPVTSNPVLAGAGPDQTVSPAGTTQLTRTVLSASRGIFLEADTAKSEQFVAAPGVLSLEIQLKHQ